MRLASIISLIAFSALGACADASCAASGAAETTPCVSGAIQYTNTPARPEPMRVVPVHIDRNFNLYERTKIFRAVNEWNHVLNGYVRLDISPADVDAASVMAAGAPRSDGWSIAKIDSRSQLLGDSMKRALAVTIGTRKAIILVVADRLGSRDLGGIMMHEFGHALGAMHDAGSQLMHPYYTGDKQRCIDKGAVRAVSVAQNLPLEGLNWCAGSGDPVNVAEHASGGRASKAAWAAARSR